MAKKKSTRKPAEMTVISIKTTVEFRDWLARQAEAERITSVQFLEKAAVAYALQLGTTEVAPKRTEGR